MIQSTRFHCSIIYTRPRITPLFSDLPAPGQTISNAIILVWLAFVIAQHQKIEAVGLLTMPAPHLTYTPTTRTFGLKGWSAHIRSIFMMVGLTRTVSISPMPSCLRAPIQAHGCRLVGATRSRSRWITTWTGTAPVSIGTESGSGSRCIWMAWTVGIVALLMHYSPADFCLNQESLSVLLPKMTILYTNGPRHSMAPHGVSF